LYIQPFGDSESIISLTGATGKCHWSAAVKVGSESFPDTGAQEFGSEHVPKESRRQLMFAIACRYRTLPNWLGSSYRPVDRVIGVGCTSTFAFAGDGHKAVMIGPRRDQILTDPRDSHDCVVSESRDATGNSMLAIRPPEGQLNAPPATVQWEYRMILATV
jgi:hypothetical protein